MARVYNLFDSSLGNVSLAPVLATGNTWFVNAATGNDNNAGNIPAAPFATLTAALAAAVANNSDVIYLNGTVHLTATLAWNKNGVSLVGMQSPSGNPRGRISSTGATAFSPLVNVTGIGCSFVNIGTFHGGFTGATGSQVCWAEAGGRNFYQNVAFQGGGDATTAALAGMRSLTIASDENEFVDCRIGLDTIVRATNVNASLELLANPVSGQGAARNVLRTCVFQSLVSATGDLHVLVGASAMDRFCLFDRCAFVNAIQSTGSTMAVAITANASAGGLILLQDCTSVGATVYATTGPVYVQGAVPTGTTSGLAVAAT